MLRGRWAVSRVVGCLCMVGSSLLWPVSEVQGQFVHNGRVGCSSHGSPCSGCPFPKTVRVKIQRTNQVETVPLEDYVTRVVASEMSDRYHPRALQMQALVARTNIVHRIWRRCISAEPVSTFDVPDSVQLEYKDLSFLRSRSRGSENLAKLLRVSAGAAEATRGMMLVYRGQPINALFSSSNNGFTQASADYFAGVPVPYLVSRRSEYEDPPVVQQDYAWVSFLSRLFPGIGSITPDDITHFCQGLVRNRSGYVRTARMRSHVLSGRQVRERLGLRSSDFTCRILPGHNRVQFTVRGYGHGVGMSQYGVNLMAKKGKTLSEMVQQYYPGANISKFS